MSSLVSLLTAASILLAIWHDSFVDATERKIPAKKNNRGSFKKIIIRSMTLSLIFSIFLVAIMAVHLEIFSKYTVYILCGVDINNNDASYMLVYIAILMITIYSIFLSVRISYRCYLSYKSPDGPADF